MLKAKHLKDIKAYSASNKPITIQFALFHMYIYYGKQKKKGGMNVWVRNITIMDF